MELTVLEVDPDVTLPIAGGLVEANGTMFAPL